MFKNAHFIFICLGEFVFGHHLIDENWWFGECFGRKGSFPVNFVWKIDTNIISVSVIIIFSLNVFSKKTFFISEW